MTSRQQSYYSPSSPRGGSSRYSTASSAASYPVPTTPTSITNHTARAVMPDQDDELERLFYSLSTALSFSAYPKTASGTSSGDMHTGTARPDDSPILPYLCETALPPVPPLPSYLISRTAHQRSLSAEEPSKRPAFQHQHSRSGSAPLASSSYSRVNLAVIEDNEVEELAPRCVTPSDRSSTSSIYSSSTCLSVPPSIPERVASRASPRPCSPSLTASPDSSSSAKRAPPRLPPSRGSSLKSSSSSVSLAIHTPASASSLSLVSTASVSTVHLQLEPSLPITAEPTVAELAPPALIADPELSPRTIIPLRRTRSAPQPRTARSHSDSDAVHMSPFHRSGQRPGLMRRASHGDSLHAKGRALLRRAMPSLMTSPSPSAIEHKAERRSSSQQPRETFLPLYDDTTNPYKGVRFTPPPLPPVRKSLVFDVYAECRAEDAEARRRAEELEARNACVDEDGDSPSRGGGLEGLFTRFPAPPRRPSRVVKFADEQPVSPGVSPTVKRKASIRRPSATAQTLRYYANQTPTQEPVPLPEPTLAGEVGMTPSQSSGSIASTVILTPSTSLALLPSPKIYEGPLPPLPTALPTPISPRTPLAKQSSLADDITPKATPRDTIPDTLLPRSAVVPAALPAMSSPRPAPSPPRVAPPASVAAVAATSATIQRIRMEADAAAAAGAGGKKERSWASWGRSGSFKTSKDKLGEKNSGVMRRKEERKKIPSFFMTDYVLG